MKFNEYVFKKFVQGPVKNAGFLYDLYKLDPFLKEINYLNHHADWTFFIIDEQKLRSLMDRKNVRFKGKLENKVKCYSLVDNQTAPCLVFRINKKYMKIKESPFSVKYEFDAAIAEIHDADSKPVTPWISFLLKNYDAYIFIPRYSKDDLEGYDIELISCVTEKLKQIFSESFSPDLGHKWERESDYSTNEIKEIYESINEWIMINS